MNDAPPIPLSLSQLQAWLPARPLNAHKGLFGHVLIIGSDYGMPGAVRIAAEGAARVGAGLVTVATRKAHVTSTISGRPEILCYGVDSNFELIDTLIEKASVVVIGPGLGQSTWSKHLIDRTISCAKPLIIDADGLNWLSADDHALQRSNWILTPHPGEAARLLHTNIDALQADRKHAIRALQQRYGGVMVLKGASTLIATNDKPLYCCLDGNPGMASAGMGDLLSGIIAGLVAQGLTPWRAARAGVLLHAMAGDRVAAKQGERGLLASDLCIELPYLLHEVSANHPQG
jgi:hydroxyethylthiazole kinase-like uncharacterized protein yjeF